MDVSRISKIAYFVMESRCLNMIDITLLSRVAYLILTIVESDKGRGNFGLLSKDSRCTVLEIVHGYESGHQHILCMALAKGYSEWLGSSDKRLEELNYSTYGYVLSNTFPYGEWSSNENQAIDEVEFLLDCFLGSDDRLTMDLHRVLAEVLTVLGRRKRSSGIDLD